MSWMIWCLLQTLTRQTNEKYVTIRSRPNADGSAW